MQEVKIDFYNPEIDFYNLGLEIYNPNISGK